MLKRRLHLDMIIRLALLLTLTQLACGLPFLATSPPPPITPTATRTPPPIPSPVVTPTEVVQVTPVAFDLCTLVTQAEAEELLGGEVAVESAQDMGNCTYNRTTTDTGEQQALFVGGAQGEEAVEMLLMGVMTLLMFSGDETAQDTFAQLEAGLATMTVKDMVESLIPLYEKLGYQATPQSEPGDEAFWLWNEEFSIGILLFVRGDAYMNVTMVGYGQEEARAAVNQIAPTVLERLPPAFSIMVTVESPPTEPPTATEPAPQDAPTPEQPSGSVVVWVTEVTQGKVIAIDAATNAVLAEIPIGVYPSDVAVGEGSVWVPSLPENTVTRLDPATYQIRTRIGFDQKVWQVEVGHGAVWVTGDFGLTRIDPVTNTPTPVVTDGRCDGVAVGENAIWVTQTALNQVLQIDPASNQVMATIPVEGGPTEVSARRGAVWVLQYDTGQVARIDIETLSITGTVPVGETPHGLEANVGGVWVAGQFRLLRIDEAKLEIVNNLDVGFHPWGIAIGADSAWITLSTGGKVVRLDLLRYEFIATIEVGGQVDRIDIGE